MLTPSLFAQKDLTLLHNFIRDYPFANLISYSDSILEANHIPLFLNTLKGKEVLQGHVAKANPLWQQLADNSEVLVVFNGPNCYISPNYYPTKKDHGKAVPTWNYMTVHARGTIRFIHDDKWNTEMINNLTKQHEAHQAEPWSIADAPDDYIQKMLGAIVGLEIEIKSITGQWKLSQNQAQKNKAGVVAGLLHSSNDKPDSEAIAAMIQTQIS